MLGHKGFAMTSADYRIESQLAIVNRFVPAHSLARPFGDLSLAVAVAAKSETRPSGGEIRVVHVPSGEVLYRSAVAVRPA